jgi:microcystin-dependent protein
MGTPYVGEIRIFAGSFAPVGWAFCDGSLLSISEYEVLFTLIGTTYGGNGQTTFALPDLRGRVPIHQGGGFALAQSGGVESVALNATQIPAHTHNFMASTNAANQGTPAGFVLAASTGVKIYSSGAPNVSLSPMALQNAGGSLPHDNRQPFGCLNFIVALDGIYPTQN